MINVRNKVPKLLGNFAYLVGSLMIISIFLPPLRQEADILSPSSQQQFVELLLLPQYFLGY
jgi:hypothetical protein